ncbi:MAG: DUF4381 domain-containing protein [Gammaproteobacteria bacterium]
MPKAATNSKKMEPLPLRDIHLPDGVGWWPPALGWWLLALLAVLLAWVLYRFYKRLTRKTAFKAAKKLLNDIRKQEGDRQQTVSALSALLRRTAVSTDVRDHVAGLQGRAWLDYLDRDFPDAPFTQGVGRCFADSHFRPNLQEDIDLESLFSLCERWLNQRVKQS